MTDLRADAQFTGTITFNANRLIYNGERYDGEYIVNAVFIDSSRGMSQNFVEVAHPDIIEECILDMIEQAQL